jgi:hypothetical protein
MMLGVSRRAAILSCFLLFVSLAIFFSIPKASKLRRIKISVSEPEPESRETEDGHEVVPWVQVPLGGCLPELEALKSAELRLSSNISYARRCVKVQLSDEAKRLPLTKVDEPLFPQSQMIDLTTCSTLENLPCDPLVLDIPKPAVGGDASHVLFGLYTTFAKFQDAIPQLEQWAAGNGIHLVVIVADSDKISSGDIKKTQDALRAKGIAATLVPPSNPSLDEAQLHLSIVEELYNAKTDSTQWMALIDEDTFFPFLPALISRLSTYDPALPHYIGALSEDWNAVRLFGYMAYGGAGVFLSAPLVSQIHGVYTQCLGGDHTERDVILRDCIYKHTTTKLSVEHELHQLDLESDVSGFFESGQRPLSLHHCKSWYKLAIEKMHAVSGICGECFLQRWMFGDGALLNNGYSVVKYREGLDVDLDRMEGTWAHPNAEYDFSLGPLRQALGEGEKSSWKLLDSGIRGDGKVWQTYVRRAREDSVLELIWEN